jgi:hypothetical protein
MKDPRVSPFGEVGLCPSCLRFPLSFAFCAVRYDVMTVWRLLRRRKLDSVPSVYDGNAMLQECTKRPCQSMFMMTFIYMLVFYIEYETQTIFYYAPLSCRSFCISDEHNYTFWAGKKPIFVHAASQHIKIERRLPDF